MMRTLAWCGMNASSWSAVTPAASSACWATGAMLQTAQRKTVWPCMPMCGQPRPCSWTSIQLSVCEIASHFSPSEPQIVGPMPGVSERLIDGRAGAVAEDERGAAVVAAR